MSPGHRAFRGYPAAQRRHASLTQSTDCMAQRAFARPRLERGPWMPAPLRLDLSHSFTQISRYHWDGESRRWLARIEDRSIPHFCPRQFPGSGKTCPAHFMIQTLRKLRPALKPLHKLFWRLHPRFERSPLACGIWQAIAERNRLKLPSVDERFMWAFRRSQIILPGVREIAFGEDAPLDDIQFLLQLARWIEPKRILEVGTYRARTTYALMLNEPTAEIVSYDIQKVESEYREELSKNALVSLRMGDFSQQKEALSAEAPFDLIFIDGGHRIHEVMADSEIAFSVLSDGGAIVWHDYRKNQFCNPGLQVPEALHQLARKHQVYAVPGTTCAIHLAATLHSRLSAVGHRTKDDARGSSPSFRS